MIIEAHFTTRPLCTVDRVEIPKQVLSLSEVIKRLLIELILSVADSFGLSDACVRLLLHFRARHLLPLETADFGGALQVRKAVYLLHRLR